MRTFGTQQCLWISAGRMHGNRQNLGHSMVISNPAKLLLVVLNAAMRHQGGQNCKVVWKQVLHVRDDSDAELFSRLGKVMTLPQQAIVLLQEHYPAQASAHHHWSNQVNSAFSNQQLMGHFDSFRDAIDRHTLNYLTMASDLLSYKVQAVELSNETLQSLSVKVSNLLQEVLSSSSIDAKAKLFVVATLHKLQSAIDEYSITGAGPILEQLDAAAGRATLDGDLAAKIRASDIAARFVDLLSATANALTVYIGIPAIADATPKITQLLGG